MTNLEKIHHVTLPAYFQCTDFKIVRSWNYEGDDFGNKKFVDVSIVKCIGKLTNGTVFLNDTGKSSEIFEVRIRTDSTQWDSEKIYHFGNIDTKPLPDEEKRLRKFLLEKFGKDRPNSFLKYFPMEDDGFEYEELWSLTLEISAELFQSLIKDIYTNRIDILKLGINWHFSKATRSHVIWEPRDNIEWVIDSSKISQHREYESFIGYIDYLSWTPILVLPDSFTKSKTR